MLCDLYSGLLNTVPWGPKKSPGGFSTLLIVTVEVKMCLCVEICRLYDVKVRNGERLELLVLRRSHKEWSIHGLSPWNMRSCMIRHGEHQTQCMTDTQKINLLETSNSQRTMTFRRQGRTKDVVLYKGFGLRQKGLVSSSTGSLSSVFLHEHSMCSRLVT